MIKHLVVSLLLSAAISAPALAETKVGALVISQPWARATPPGARVAGAYLTVINTGSADDRLVSVSSGATERAELHSMSMSGGVMSMRLIADGIAIPAGASVTLSPSETHIMLVGPKQPLRRGGTFPLKLTFAKAGSVDVDFAIEAIGAKGPATAAGAGAAPSMPGMDMPGKDMPGKDMPGKDMPGMKMDHAAP